MIYLFLKGGILFFDADEFAYKVLGNELWVFNNNICVAKFNKDIVSIMDSDDEIIYKGDKV